MRCCLVYGRSSKPAAKLALSLPRAIWSSLIPHSKVGRETAPILSGVPYVIYWEISPSFPVSLHQQGCMRRVKRKGMMIHLPQVAA